MDREDGDAALAGDLGRVEAVSTDVFDLHIRYRLEKAEALLREWMEPAVRVTARMVWDRTAAFLAELQVEAGPAAELGRQSQDDVNVGSASFDSGRSGARPEQQLAAGGESDGVARQGSTTVTYSQRAPAGENPAPGAPAVLRECGHPRHESHRECLVCRQAKAYEDLGANQCEHGSLRRQCVVCELTDECDALRSGLADAEATVVELRANIRKNDLIAASNYRASDTIEARLRNERDELLAWAREAYRELETEQLHLENIKGPRADLLLWLMDRAPSAVKEGKP